MCSILFTLIRIFQSVSLNRGELDDKQHPLVTKSRIIGLHMASHCGLPSLVPQRSHRQECFVPGLILLSHGQPEVQRKRKGEAFSVSYPKTCCNEGAAQSSFQHLGQAELGLELELEMKTAHSPPHRGSLASDPGGSSIPLELCPIPWAAVSQAQRRSAGMPAWDTTGMCEQQLVLFLSVIPTSILLLPSVQVQPDPQQC